MQLIYISVCSFHPSIPALMRYLLLSSGSYADFFFHISDFFYVLAFLMRSLMIFTFSDVDGSSGDMISKKSDPLGGSGEKLYNIGILSMSKSSSLSISVSQGRRFPQSWRRTSSASSPEKIIVYIHWVLINDQRSISSSASVRI